MSDEGTPRHGGDLRFLEEASRRLHGYSLFLAFQNYLHRIEERSRGWIGRDLLDAEGRATETGRIHLSDIQRADLGRLQSLVGTYLLVLAGHKKANEHLMRQSRRTRLLYLRGFDFETVVGDPEGMAARGRTVDTSRFSRWLGRHLSSWCEIFSPLSPGDLQQAIKTVRPAFEGDFNAIVQAAADPIRHLYFSASSWQNDVSDLIDRMDTVVVYVASITDSVFWELDRLRSKGRQSDTTVVFDLEAIRTKGGHDAFQSRMREERGDDLVWERRTSTARADQSLEEIRSSLEFDFVVLSREEFEARLIDDPRAVLVGTSPIPVGRRERYLPFRFRPAVERKELRRIEEFRAELDKKIATQLSRGEIDGPAILLNDLELATFLAFMLGRHAAAGRNLAIYSEAIATIGEFVREQGSQLEAPEEIVALNVGTLNEQADYAAHAAVTLMAFGESHEFGHYFDDAQETFHHLCGVTRTALGATLDRLAGST